jgi:hypothetical protein
MARNRVSSSFAEEAIPFEHLRELRWSVQQLHDEAECTEKHSLAAEIRDEFGQELNMVRFEMRH